MKKLGNARIEVCRGMALLIQPGFEMRMEELIQRSSSQAHRKDFLGRQKADAKGCRCE